MQAADVASAGGAAAPAGGDAAAPAADVVADNSTTEDDPFAGGVLVQNGIVQYLFKLLGVEARMW